MLAQAGLNLLASSDPPMSGSVAEGTGVCHGASIVDPQASSHSVSTSHLTMGTQGV